MDERDRRQRWAAFSVRAHTDLHALSTDILLYDRLIIPMPADDSEYARFEEQGWRPDEIELRKIQSAGRIITIPWTAELRAEWTDGYKQLSELAAEVAYGYTGYIAATSPAAWQEIAAAAYEYPDLHVDRKPFLIAGYQSEREAFASLQLQPTMPGNRAADLAVALHIERIVARPDIVDPLDAFLTSVALSDDPAFQQSRRRLFDWEDALYIDECEPEEIERELADIENQYDQAVHDFTDKTRRHKVASLLPGAAAHLAHTAGPVAGFAAKSGVSFLAGKFAPMPTTDPNRLPGRAVAMIRAAYRDTAAAQVAS